MFTSEFSRKTLDSITFLRSNASVVKSVPIENGWTKNNIYTLIEAIL